MPAITVQAAPLFAIPSYLRMKDLTRILLALVGVPKDASLSKES